MRIDYGDGTITDLALLRARAASARPAKARADQGSMPAECTGRPSPRGQRQGRLTHDQQRPHRATDARMRTHESRRARLHRSHLARRREPSRLWRHRMDSPRTPGKRGRLAAPLTGINARSDHEASDRVRVGWAVGEGVRSIVVLGHLRPACRPQPAFLGSSPSVTPLTRA